MEIAIPLYVAEESGPALGGAVGTLTGERDGGETGDDGTDGEPGPALGGLGGRDGCETGDDGTDGDDGTGAGDETGCKVVGGGVAGHTGKLTSKTGLDEPRTHRIMLKVRM